MSDLTPENPAEPPKAPTPPPGASAPPPGASAPPPGASAPPPGASAPPPGAQYRGAGVPSTGGNAMGVNMMGGNMMGVLALFAGLLSFTCLPLIGSIPAIIFGRIGIKKADQGLATNGGMARVGFWLGVISLILSAIGFLIIIILSIVSAISGVDGSCGVGTNTPCNV